MQSLLSFFLFGLASSQPEEILLCQGDNVNPATTCNVKPDTKDFFQTVILTNTFQYDVNINCREIAQCKNRLRILGSTGPLGMFHIDCIRQDTCQLANIELGIPITIPNGYFPADFNGKHGHVDIDCLGKASCVDMSIKVTGDFPDGVDINALGQDSFHGASVECNLKPGQRCRVICDDSSSCTGSSVTCSNGAICICLGNSCPNMPHGVNSDPAAPVSIGDSPNIPGLECLAGTDDNPPDACRFDPFIEESFNGVIVCSENYDCCLCKQLLCVEGCTAVVCNGDSSCVGVPMLIDGDDKLGASISCNGDLSCQRSVIDAVDITAIKADGDLSLSGAVINANIRPYKLNAPLSMPCNGDGSCKNAVINARNVLNILCNGDNSCEHTIANVQCRTIGRDKGCVISCGGDLSCHDSKWLLTDVESIVANGDISVGFSKWDFSYVEAGGPLVCGGDESCKNCTFGITRLNRLACDGDMSCSKSLYNADCVTSGNDKGCPLTCGGDMSCENSNWRVNGATGIVANGVSACMKSKMRLNFVVAGGFVTCGGTLACEMADFAITNVQSVECVGIQSCQESRFDFQCTSSGGKGCPLTCGGPSSCLRAKWNVINAQSITCVGAMSCDKVNYLIDCAPGDFGCSTICAGRQSCQNSRFNIANSGSLNCAGIHSCVDAKFELLGAKNGMDIDCFGIGACQRSMIMASNVRQIKCGPTACENTTQIVQCSKQNGCPMECSGERSCYGGEYNVTNGAGLICTRQACTKALFRFSNHDGGFLTCTGPDACTNSRIFGVDNIIGLSCVGVNSCNNAIITGSCKSSCGLTCSGIESCINADIYLESVKELKCDGSRSCENAKLKTTTKDSGFKLSCGSVDSCIGAMFKVMSESSSIGGILCASVGSCRDSTFIIEGVNGETEIKEIKCAGNAACVRTKFILKNAYISESMFDNACTAPGSCDNDELSIQCQDEFGQDISMDECIR